MLLCFKDKSVQPQSWIITFVSCIHLSSSYCSITCSCFYHKNQDLSRIGKGNWYQYATKAYLGGCGPHRSIIHKEITPEASLNILHCLGCHHPSQFLSEIQLFDPFFNVVNPTSLARSFFFTHKITIIIVIL